MVISFRFAALSALLFPLFISFTSEPACAAPAAKSSQQSDTAKLARVSGLRPLTKAEQDFPVEEGRSLVSRGNYARALFVLQSNISSAYFRQGRLDDAIAAAKKALRISDRFIDCHSSLATICRAKNQFDLERQELEAVNRCRQLRAKDNLNLSNLSRSKYMYDLISQKPQSAKKQIAMGVIHKQFNNFAESEKCHLAAVKLDGKLVEAHWSYGLLQQVSADGA